MEIFYTIAAFSGLASSFHCIGMCGPIAMALPVGRLSKGEAILAKILYNLGRIISYSTLGLVFGYFGKALFVAGFQQNISIIIGVFLFASLFYKKLNSLSFFSKASKFISTIIKKMLFSHLPNYLFLGVLNGLLPCGMVYMALAGALATSSLMGGVVFMALFGLGTTPMMFLVSMLPSFITLKFRKNINKYLPAYTLFLSLFFMIRGMGLGIPYMSPVFEKTVQGNTITICHSEKKHK